MSLASLRVLGLLAAAATLATFGCAEGTDDVIATGGVSGVAVECNHRAELTGDPLYTFAEDIEGFTKEAYAADPPYKNLSNSGDNPYDGRVVVRWSDAEGIDGEPGVIELSAPFGGYQELVDLQLNLDEPVDWSDKTIRAYVKIVDGFVPSRTDPGGGYVFVKTGTAFVFGRGAWTKLWPECQGEWIEFAIHIAVPDEANAGYDPTDVRSIGVQVSTGDGPIVPEDLPTPATVYIDSFTIE
jgi:hypothetical protein